MWGVIRSNIVAQGLPTATLGSRRAQTRMHNGLTQRKEEKGSSTQNKKYPKQKQGYPNRYTHNINIYINNFIF